MSTQFTNNIKLLKWAGWLCLLLVSPVSVLAAPDTYLANPEQGPGEHFRGVFAQVAPNVWLAGQPSEAGFALAKSKGLTTVVNLRTDAEMSNRQVVPFDEAALLAELGMRYVHLPQGGPDTPYATSSVTALSDAIAQARAQGEGVLLHCTVAWRATHLWVAYLVRTQGLSLDEAVQIGQQINLGLMPLEGFLGGSIEMRLGEEEGRNE